MKRSGFKRYGYKRSTKALKAGRKTKAWMAVRRKLKVEYAQMGITSCELRYEGCWNDNGLGFLHIRKRRHLKDGELKIVVLGCNPCHDRVERLPEAEMTAILLGVIARRNLCQGKAA